MIECEMKLFSRGDIKHLISVSAPREKATISLIALSGSEDAEMRYRFSQRASLYLYSIAGYYPNHIQKIIKKLYDLRSKVVHGSTALKSLENEIIKIGNEKIEFENGVIEFKSNHIDLSSALVILREIIRQMLFDALLNHSNKSKTMFLEYIDNSWYELKDISKFKLIDENIIKYSTKNYWFPFKEIILIRNCRNWFFR